MTPTIHSRPAVKLMFRCALILIVVSFQFDLMNGQCMMVPLLMEDQVSNSDLMVEGVVKDKNAFITAAGDYIFTTYQIEITKIFKGKSQKTSVTVIESGGIVGERAIEVTPSIELQVGESGTFFLELFHFKDARENDRFHEPVYRAYASRQSVFTYDFKSNMVVGHFNHFALDQWYEVLTHLTGSNYKNIQPLPHPDVSASRMVPSITSMTPLTISSGTFSILTINGNGFGASMGTSTVEFKNANDGGATWLAATAPHVVSWNDAQIQIKVPYQAGSGQVRVTVSGAPIISSQSLTIPYSQFSVQFDIGGGVQAIFRRTLYNNNGAGGYTFHYHTEFNTNTPARKSFERALNSWRCGMNVNFIVGDAITIDNAVEDGYNVIRFDNGAELPAGVGARCTSYLNNCVNVDFYATHIKEIDLVFNDAFAGIQWQYGPALPSATEVDFESIALHELGHACALGHVNLPSAVLHYIIGPGEVKRVLSANDLTGAAYIHAQSTGNPEYCDNLPMTNYRQIKYVNINTTGNQTGDSWTEAYKYLQDALNVITSCVDTVYVANGYYFPDEGEGMSNNDQSLKFLFDDNVVWMGGYNASTGLRNLTVPSILSGDIDKNNSSDAPNSLNVVRITAAAQLDGFYIENGYADGTTGDGMLGAGLYITGNAVIRNCLIRWNTALGSPPTAYGRGGGVYQSGGSSVFENVTLYSNFALITGTAFQIDGGSVQCTNCTIAGNAPNTVAVRIENGAHIFRNSIFWNNQSDLQVGGGSVNVSYSMLQSSSLPGGVTGTNVLFNTDPLFVYQAGYNFALTPCSPAVNTGNNAYNSTNIDMLSNPRFVGTIDRGAMENTTGGPATQVTNALDDGAGSLRYIIANACPNNTITFSNTLMNDTIVLTGAQIVLDRNLTIDGLGLNNLFLSANGTHRHFSQPTGFTSTIKNMTLIDGNAVAGNCISNAGTLTLQNLRLKKKTTSPNPYTLYNNAGGSITISNQVFLQ